MAQRGQRRSGGARTAPRAQRRTRDLDNEGIIPVLAKAVREVEGAVQRGAVRPSVRTKFQVVAHLVREERARIKADEETSEGQKAAQLKRLDGVATILAKTSTRETSMLALLAEDADFSHSARELKAEMQRAAGLEVEVEKPAPAPEPGADAQVDRRVVPPSVISRQLANPFLVPDFGVADATRPRNGRLAGWELLGPLFRSFEYAGGGAPACMPLPDPSAFRAPDGMQLMPHQAQMVAAAAAGHRSFLLADEPGLGKTAQALLAAQAADAYPLLCVVPNVVKTNWAREAGLWTPHRPVTVIHGDGSDIDGFADIVVVNYEVLDRHVGWLGDLGFKGMVVDEAHFIKNKTSQRSQHVLQLSERIRSRTAHPLLMALTGTPLINDLEDFRAIWQFLGWIDDRKPLGKLMDALEETGLTPAEPAFYGAARAKVIDMGIVRRRKVDVAADIPARRVADLPVELDDALGRSIRDAERELARRLPGDPHLRRGRRRHRPRARTPRRDVGARGHRRRQERRERLLDDAPHRPGQGRAGRRLRRPAGAQRRQGRLLRQARRRDGRGRGDLRAPRAALHLDPRRPDAQGPRSRHQGLPGGPRRRRGGLLALGRRRGAQPAGGLQPGASTASARSSRSPRGASSPRTPSTPASPS